MSTNESDVGTSFAEFEISPSTSSFLSGTATTPTLGSMVQNGKLAACACDSCISALNSVDLPTFGSPTIPVLRAIDTTGVLRKWRRRAADECSSRAPRGAKPPAGATASDKATSIRRPEDIMARKSNATEATATANEVAALSPR